MGSWGITMRQSDCGVELLDTIVVMQLRQGIAMPSNLNLRRCAGGLGR